MATKEGKSALRPLRVLIVEDSEDDAILVIRELQRAGYAPDYLRVDTPDAFRAAMRNGGWDVIISDHRMPYFDSQSALRMLREKDVETPFIIVSGSIGEDMAVAAMKSGVNDYVMKDRMARLAPAIERELGDAEIRRARRKAEDALRESEARYRELVEEIPAITYIAGLDDERTVFYISPQIEVALGISTADQRQLWKKYLHADDRARVLEELGRALEQQSAFVSEYRLQGPDGRVVWFHDDAVVVKDQTGRSIFLRGFMQNITERKKTEETLRERDEQLRRFQKLEAVGRLAGGVAHDFNNLLTPILGYSKIVMGEIASRPDLKECMQEVMNAAERAAKLTQQLLTFGRKQAAQMKPLDINQTVREMERFLRRTIGEDVELITALDPGLGIVQADPTNMEQIVMNLAVNARDAMARGGTLTIHTRNVVFDEPAIRHHPGAELGEYVMLSVRDTGCGMTPEVLEHAFEPFFTTKEEGKGTGLGLSIIYGIVQQGRGFVDVDSQPDQGTEVRIYFPRLSAGATRPSPAAPDVAPTGTESILVVEDEEIVRNMTVRILKSLGYRVHEASAGPAAMATWDQIQGKVDLLITDVVMPLMSGHQLVGQLRKSVPHLKVLYISGFTRNAIVHHGVVDEGVSLLMKPYTRETLAQKVRDVLDA